MRVRLRAPTLPAQSVRLRPSEGGENRGVGDALQPVFAGHWYREGRDGLRDDLIHNPAHHAGSRGGAAQGAGFHCGDEQFPEQRADLKHAYLARTPPPLVAGPPAFRLRR